MRKYKEENHHLTIRSCYCLSHNIHAFLQVDWCGAPSWLRTVVVPQGSNSLSEHSEGIILHGWSFYPLLMFIHCLVNRFDRGFEQASRMEDIEDTFLKGGPSSRTQHMDPIIQAMTRMAKDPVVIAVKEVGNGVITTMDGVACFMFNE